MGAKSGPKAPSVKDLLSTSRFLSNAKTPSLCRRRGIITRKPVILVVDDEPQILRVMRASLPPRGYEVVTARGGQEALDQIQKEMPDLIILDLVMPEMSGLEVCRQVREFASVPILVLSA